MSELHLITPRLPTALKDADVYWLSDSDLLLQFPVETGFLLEGHLDLERLSNALEEALSAFPLFCGRLIRQSRDLGVKLLNGPVQLEVVHSNDYTMLPEDSVIQDPWVYSTPLDMDAIRAYKDEPLFKMRLTYFQTSPPVTVLAATSAHLVGDGSFMVRFWRLLSQCYQSLPPLEPYPTYSRATLETLSNVEHLYPFFPQLLARNPRTPPHTQRITLFFSQDQLDSLREKVQQEFIETGLCKDFVIRPSIQDCVTALICVACTNALTRKDASAPPVTIISNVLNVRGGVLPWEEPVNALSWANATTSAPYNLVKTAFAVRQSFIHSREPSFQAACLLAVRQLWRRAADEEEKVDFTPQPGNLVLNSSWRFDYTTAHFGFGKDKSHFLHTIAKAPRYSKMFKRNPSLPLSRNGVAQERRALDGAEFTFYLLPEHTNGFYECLEEQWKLLGIEGEIETMTRASSDRAT